MTTINTRPKSPTRTEAIAKALKPGPNYCTSVLIGNWVEDRIECPKGGTFYFPPKEVIDYEKLKPESRRQDARINKLNESQQYCGNFATTTDLIYNHLPKPLCGPVHRHYNRIAQTFYPQPDLMMCFGNVTKWGLKQTKDHEWACTGVSDYITTLYEDTYVPPLPHEYLPRNERKARNSSFTKTFRFKMTKSKN